MVLFNCLNIAIDHTFSSLVTLILKCICNNSFEDSLSLLFGLPQTQLLLSTFSYLWLMLVGSLECFIEYWMFEIISQKLWFWFSSLRPVVVVSLFIYLVACWRTIPKDMLLLQGAVLSFLSGCGLAQVALSPELCLSLSSSAPKLLGAQSVLIPAVY